MRAPNVIPALMLATALAAQQPDPAATTVYQRTRLILKDGSYQSVLGYSVVGKVVDYRSAERNGELEEVPLKLVDLPATIAWYHAHVAADAPAQADRPVLSPSLAKEEADRATYSPLVQPGLRLPPELSVIALDTFSATPQLVPLPQQGTDLSREGAHGVLPQAVNPLSAPHRILELKHPRADVQLHVANPVFYVRIGDDLADTGTGFQVDTHGAPQAETPAGGAAGSAYVIERLSPLQDSRLVNSFKLAWLNTGRAQPEIIETREQELPGGHWLQLTPTAPLDPGEYALVEVVSDHELNLNVWDFGIHPAAPQSIEAILPDTRKPQLKSRQP